MKGKVKFLKGHSGNKVKHCFTIESFLFGLQMLNRISLRAFFQHDEALCIFYHFGGWMTFLHMTTQMTLTRKIFLAVFTLLSWSSCVNNHVLLQVPFLRKSFLAVTTFVLCSFFMESVHMFAKTVRSVESLSTFFTCQHTSACMNLKMPCKVCFFEHISTFVTFLLLMRLNAVLGQFGSGFKCFSTHCTDILRHCLDFAKVRAELALYVPKKSKSRLATYLNL